MAKTQMTLPDAPHIVVTLKRVARARRFSLRVSRVDGAVTLTMPPGAPMDQAQAFVHEKTDWIVGTLSQMPLPDALRVGGTIPFEGREHHLVAAPRRSACVVAGRIEVPADPDRLHSSLHSLMKTAARDRLAPACDAYAAKLGMPYGRLSLRDTRSRWGSCTSEGNLMFSWRLIMAPPEVLQYVAAHEVAHLKEMNHSSRFWALVERLYPGYAAQRGWLHEHGSALQQIRFEP